MKLLTLACLTACLSMATSWPDCSPQLDGHVPYNGTTASKGSYQPVQRFTAMWQDHPIAVFLPSGAKAYPLFVFMHGSTGQVEMYEENLLNYASHGFIVMFPYIKNPKDDTHPLTTNTNGEFILHAVDFANFSAVANASSLLFGRVDLTNVVLAGHSMGATCSIMAGKRSESDPRVPPDSVKLIVTQHPGICGPIGPPPWPSTWLKSDLSSVVRNYPVLFTTATNDGAFWPAPQTAAHEMGCFNGSVTDHDPHPATFIQFSEDACLEDGVHDPFPDAGHNCPFKNGVETPWVLTASKLYAQQGGNLQSQCAAMLYGRGEDSLALDTQVQSVLFSSTPMMEY